MELALAADSGLGGSVAFYDPRSGAAVAVLLGQMSRTRGATRAVLRAVSDALGAPHLAALPV